MLTAQRGHKEVVKLLLERGADIEAKSDNCFNSIMIVACSSNAKSNVAKIEGSQNNNSRQPYNV